MGSGAWRSEGRRGDRLGRGGIEARGLIEPGPGVEVECELGRPARWVQVRRPGGCLFTRRRRGPWRSLEDVELATLEWVWWFNYHRLLEPIGYVPPVEHEEAYYRRQEAPAELAALKSGDLR